MARSQHTIGKIFFLITAICEGAAVTVICLQIHSHCVSGGEIAFNVMWCLFLLPVAFIGDLVFVILMLKLKTLGMDPVAVMYNFVMGCCCCLGAFPAIIVVLGLCGNAAQIYIIVSGVLALLAGIIHFTNAFYFNRRLPTAEKEWPTRRHLRIKSKSRSRSLSTPRATPERGIMKKPTPITKHSPTPPKKKSPTPPKEKSRTPCWKKCASCRRKQRNKKITAKKEPSPTPPPSCKKKDPWAKCRAAMQICKGKKPPEPPPQSSGMSKCCQRSKSPSPAPSMKDNKQKTAVAKKEPWCKCFKKKDKQTPIKPSTPPSSPKPTKLAKQKQKKENPQTPPTSSGLSKCCRRSESPSPAPYNKGKKQKVKIQKPKREKSQTPPNSSGSSKYGSRSESPYPTPPKKTTKQKIVTKGKKAWCKCFQKEEDPCKGSQHVSAKPATPPPSPKTSKKKEKEKPKKGRSETPTSSSGFFKCCQRDKTPPDYKSGKKAKIENTKTPPPSRDKSVSPVPPKKGNKQKIVEKGKQAWCKCFKKKEKPLEDTRCKSVTPPPSPKSQKTAKKEKPKREKSKSPLSSPRYSKSNKTPTSEKRNERSKTPPPSPISSSQGFQCRAVFNKLIGKKDDPCEAEKKLATPSPGSERKRKTTPPRSRHAKLPPSPKPSPQPKEKKERREKSPKRPWSKCCEKKEDPCEDPKRKSKPTKTATPPPSPKPVKKVTYVEPKPRWSCRSLFKKKDDPCQGRRSVSASSASS